MSKKKNKKSNPHSAPKPKAKPAPTSKWNQPLVWGIAAIVIMAILVVAAVLLLNKPTASSQAQTTDPASTPTPTSTTETYTPPALEDDVTYTAKIDIQDYGTVTVKLDQSAAPITCANFVELAESGFYDGLTFHRIIEGSMMQGGDPEGTGYGGSEHNIVGEFSSNGYDNPLSHTRGAISMARSNDPNSASSQFFIVQQDATFWDGDYAVFGYVTDGMDVVDAVCEAAQPTDGNGTIPADQQPVITSITILTDQ